jgi:hypothetical protein
VTKLPLRATPHAAAEMPAVGCVAVAVSTREQVRSPSIPAGYVWM